MTAKNAKFFFWSQASYGMATSVFDMVYNLHLNAIGIESDKIGTILLSGFLIMALTTIPLGYGADRIGDKRAMVASSLAFALLMMAFSYPVRWQTHAVLFSLCSACSALMLASTNAIAGKIERDPEKSRALFRTGFVYFLVASAIGNLLIGVMLRGQQAGRLGDVLLLAALAGLPMGLLRSFLKPAALESRARTAIPAEPPKFGWQDLLTIPLLAVLLGASSVLGIRYLNLVLTQRYGVDLGQLGFLFAIERTASFVGIFLLRPVLSRNSPLLGAALLGVLCLPLLALSAFAGNVLFFMVPYLARQGIHYSQMPTLDWLTNEVAPEGRRVFFNALQRFGLFMGSGAASFVYGRLLAQHNFAQAFYLSGVLAACAGILWWIISRRDRDMKADAFISRK